jgi:hypothetical protein
MECQLQMHEVAQKLVSTPLFSFQDLKLSTRDIITILEDTLNTTSGPLPIPDPHVTEIPSNTLERRSIGSRVADGVHNLVTSSSMAKLVGFPTSDSTFTYQKGIQNTSLVDLLLSKGVVDSHSLHKVSHSFPKVVPSERTSIATGVAIVDNTGSVIQVGGHTPRVVLLDTGAQPVIPADIQHGPEVLQRFKAAHEPLVKALSSFESMESHGEPIKPLLRQLITWTPPKEGITLLELFGGIGIGLEALLQSGVVVQRYFYVDIDPIARQVAASRMMELTARFPQQFATTAWKASFTFLPSDIQLI